MNPFDFTYLDADKPNYDNYYEMLSKHLKPNCWIVFDNVYLGYKVIIDEKENDDEQTKAFRKLNSLLKNDERVEINMLALAHGTTIVRKK